jgi:hypothetical protein
MEMSQGNSLCSYLKQTKHASSFSFTKLEKKRWNRSCGGRAVITSEKVRKGCRRVNMTSFQHNNKNN